MTEYNSRWRTEELSKTFLEHVHGAIPGNEMQLAVMGHILRDWAPNATRILDVGCGNGILGRFLLDLYADAHAVFLDFSEPMLEATREKLGDCLRATVVQGDFGEPAWVDAATPHGPFDLVVSGFAIHHQPHARKRAIYAEIFTLLRPGGVFLNLEHVESASDADRQLFDTFFVDHLYRYHLAQDPDADRQQIADAYYNRPDKDENILAPLDTQCAWLRDIGFADVDCFFKLFELSVFGGRKPANR